MAQSANYDQILLDHREVLLDQLARGLAGVQGAPLMSEDANADDEDAAWMARDKRVMPEHLAQIAEQAIQELSQQTDEQGRPLWTQAEIASAVKGRQEAAKYPYRHLTYSIGTVKPEEQIAKADRVAKRVARKYGFVDVDLGGGGWEVADNAPGLGDLMSSGPQMGQQQPQQAPAQGQPTMGGYS